MVSIVTYGIFTEDIHIEKIVNYLNQWSDISYIISNRPWDTESYDFAIGITYCFDWRIGLNDKIQKKRTWYDYQPTPTPEYGNPENYSKGVSHSTRYWAVSLYQVTGTICEKPLACRPFKFDSYPTTTTEMILLVHYKLFQLFKETINYLQYNPQTEEELKKTIKNHEKDVVQSVPIDEFEEFENNELWKQCP